MLNLRRKLIAAALLLAAPALLSAPPALVAQTKATKSKPAAAAKADKIDVNTATADQLKAFPGIGDAYAARIIAHRPYTAKNQLVSRGAIPQGVYDKIKDQIIAHPPKK